ncbi:MAG: ABC transporter permease [Deltaproteobacteria bacterium]|nr:ABC transporter permease [Deltaproteobacteria bacterium]
MAREAALGGSAAKGRGAASDLSRLAERLHVSTIVVFVLVLLVWRALSSAFGSYVMPPPGAVVAGLRRVLVSGELWKHAGATFYRIVVGFGLALVAAITMGLLASAWRQARIAVHDVIAVLNSTSVFVWIVVSLIWFGLTDMAPMFTTLMITLPVLASNVVEGVENVDPRHLEMARVYRLGEWERFRSIVIPSTIPYLVAGMKVGFGLALKVSVVAEIFGVTSGVGYIMNYSREILATDMVFVWAAVMILIMMLTDKLVFEALSRRVQRWR